MCNVLLIEPFYGGSHKLLIDYLQRVLVEKYSPEEIHVATMKAKKWHWRARTAALHLANDIAAIRFNIIFSSSVLNLAELIALRPDLRDAKKIVYFHENQLVYPVRKQRDRDFQYGYNQILTCLVADEIVFNSKFNLESFLGNIENFCKILPDYRPKKIGERIRYKCSVIYFPIAVTQINAEKSFEVLRIVWPHRWEFDKNPEEFLKIIKNLKSNGCKFRVSVLGEVFSCVSNEFAETKDYLEEYVTHWGPLPKDEYFEALRLSHVAVSTALHEFFGVAMLEATMSGCYPLCPKGLVYPEIYPSECLYTNYEDLEKKLQDFCNNPSLASQQRQTLQIDFSKYDDKNLKDQYLKLF